MLRVKSNGRWAGILNASVESPVSFGFNLRWDPCDFQWTSMEPQLHDYPPGVPCYHGKSSYGCNGSPEISRTLLSMHVMTLCKMNSMPSQWEERRGHAKSSRSWNWISCSQAATGTTLSSNPELLKFLLHCCSFLCQAYYDVSSWSISHCEIRN